MKDSFHKQLFNTSHTGYDFNRVIRDQDGNLCDHEILNNKACES
jgi:hypothetical protein